MKNATEFSLSPEEQVWQNLKQAITLSSGFQCWEEEQHKTESLPLDSLDERVRAYLRETLETLAY